MSYRLCPTARRQYLDVNGAPLAGAKLFYYLTTTTTKSDTYKDVAGSAINTNPIILDSSGMTPFAVFLNENIIYSEVLAPATDSDPPTSPIYTENGIATLTVTNKGTGSVLVGASTAIITHGLTSTPAEQDIIITPKVSLSGSGLSSWWISAVSSTTFTVSVNTNVTTVAYSFGWKANI